MIDELVSSSRKLKFLDGIFSFREIEIVKWRTFKKYMDAINENLWKIITITTNLFRFFR